MERPSAFLRFRRILWLFSVNQSFAHPAVHWQIAINRRRHWSIMPFLALKAISFGQSVWWPPMAAKNITDLPSDAIIHAIKPIGPDNIVVLRLMQGSDWTLLLSVWAERLPRKIELFGHFRRALRCVHQQKSLKCHSGLHHQARFASSQDVKIDFVA